MLSVELPEELERKVKHIATAWEAWVRAGDLQIVGAHRPNAAHPVWPSARNAAGTWFHVGMGHPTPC